MSRDSIYNTEAVQAAQWSARDEERERPRRVREDSAMRRERIRRAIGWNFVRNYDEEK